MASTNDFVELLENSDFKNLTAQILATIAQSRKSSANANLVCDALLFVNALICEASPFNDGQTGLRDAHKQISNDAKAMLAFVRDASTRQGKPLLFTMSEARVIN